MTHIPVHPAIRQHLANCGITTEEETENYLFPKLRDLPSPFLLKSIDTAVELEPRFDQLPARAPDSAALGRLYQELGFISLLKKIESEPSASDTK